MNAGPCVGGPRDGQSMAHTASIVEIFNATVRGNILEPQRGWVDAVVSGQYVWVSLGRWWRWVPFGDDRLGGRVACR